mmetsp:Transcript_40630/g.67493  ORF Transcript_40630/g.67493 Transcript_40630/m.67493 type:complete len:319 (-) Transcript_40630:331-1287(-)
MTNHSPAHPAPSAALQVLVLGVLVCCIYSLAVVPTGLQDVTAVSIGTPADGVSPHTLLILRAAWFALFARIIYLDLTRPPKPMCPITWPGSKLKGLTIQLSGLGRYMAFTACCWSLTALYFFGASLCSMAVVFKWHIPPVLSHGAGAVLLLVFETAFSTALVVTTAVTFVLIPGARKRGDCNIFFYFRPLVMHNANILAVFTELLLNRLTFKAAHYPATILYGVCYVMLSWYNLRRLGVVLYPFIDPTLPWNETYINHIALLAALATFYLFGWALATASTFMSIWPKAAMLLLIARSIMCVRHPDGRTAAVPGAPGFF